MLTEPNTIFTDNLVTNQWIFFNKVEEKNDYLCTFFYSTLFKNIHWVVVLNNFDVNLLLIGKKKKCM